MPGVLVTGCFSWTILAPAGLVLRATSDHTEQVERGLESLPDGSHWAQAGEALRGGSATAIVLPRNKWAQHWVASNISRSLVLMDSVAGIPTGTEGWLASAPQILRPWLGDSKAGVTPSRNPHNMGWGGASPYWLRLPMAHVSALRRRD